MRIRQLALIVAVIGVASWACSGGSSTPKSPPGSPGPAVLPTVVGTFTTLPDGLSYLDITVGSGPAAQSNQVVHVTYTLWVDTVTAIVRLGGTTDKPIEFALDRREAIPGMEEGVKGMRVGGTRRLRIPSKLAYGSAGLGRGIAQVVPPDTPVIVDVTLVSLGAVLPPVTPAAGTPTPAGSPTAAAP